MGTDAKSYLVGLIGAGIMETLSAPMHEREAAFHGLSYLYRPIDLNIIGRPGDDVGQLLQNARELSFNAFNITHPCKQLVMQHLDEISDDAERLGAVNTVLIHDGKFIGHNTDFSGFSTGLRTGLPDAERGTVLQLGTGGAGAAVAYALLRSGVKILHLSDVDTARAAERATALSELFPDQIVDAVPAADAPAALAAADGLVNATPVGMHLHPGLPLDITALSSTQWVADVVYRPIETELIQAARARGCQVLDGGHMAVGQAVDAFRLITGVNPEADRMRQHFLQMIDEGR